MLATKTITAQDGWTDAARMPCGKFNLSVSGTFAATVTVQRSFDDGLTWHDVHELTAPAELRGEEPEQSHPVWYRAGVKTGDFTSGSVVVRLSR
jgi:hypothetical protein